MRSNLDFAIHDRVRIVDLGKLGHVRTPIYVREKIGVVVRHCGAFENPEERAYGRKGTDRIPIYRVRLRQKDIWPDYDGGPDDVLEIDIYAHWLKSASSGEKT
jgi:nitrile hydratase subunit beta